MELGQRKYIYIYIWYQKLKQDLLVAACIEHDVSTGITFTLTTGLIKCNIF